jgi:hypothetical protein
MSKMHRWTRRALTLVPVLGLAVSFGGLAAPVAAHAQTFTCSGEVETCAIYYGNDHAWNNWNGSTQENNPIDFYQSLSAANGEWVIGEVNTVCDNEPSCGSRLWPFTDGSGLNARYNGDPVLDIVWNQDMGDYCATQDEFDAGDDSGPVTLNGCDLTSTQDEFVLSGSYYLSPVYADNQAYAANGTSALPILVGDVNGGTGNGDTINMNADSVGGLQWNIVPWGS